MTKLFIENRDKVNSTNVRIYPLNIASQIQNPEGFTSMDALGVSFGITLQPRPSFECTGTVARGGGIELLGDGAVTLTGNDELTSTTREETLNNIRDMGFDVDMLPLWSNVIQCVGGKPVTGIYSSYRRQDFEIVIDGVSIGKDFLFGQGNARIIRELNKRGLDIEFMQELG